jgi:hypothetical protein
MQIHEKAVAMAGFSIEKEAEGGEGVLVWVVADEGERDMVGVQVEVVTELHMEHAVKTGQVVEEEEVEEV